MPRNPDEPVTVAKLSSEASARFIAAELEANLIPAQVLSAGAGLFGSIISPAGVLVRRCDHEAAYLLLAQFRSERVSIRCRACGYSLAGLEDTDRCPECGGPALEMTSLEAELFPPEGESDPRRILPRFVIAVSVAMVTAGLVILLIRLNTGP